MADIVSREKRRQMMAGIREKNTSPELLIRSSLHRIGFRFRVHQKKLPGKPDLVLSKYNSVIFINGCFWHKHDCSLFKWPSTRKEFWKEKLMGNEKRDSKNLEGLREAGWRIAIVWECALKGRNKLPLKLVIDELDVFLRGKNQLLNIEGKKV